jgi:hypothetical protein
MGRMVVVCFMLLLGQQPPNAACALAFQPPSAPGGSPQRLTAPSLGETPGAAARLTDGVEVRARVPAACACARACSSAR